MAAFDGGRSLVKAKKFEEAIEFFGEALQVHVTKHGEEHPKTAEAYFEYGNVLVQAEEAKANVFGGELDKSEGEAPASGKGDDCSAPAAAEGGAEDGGDMELAWEMLEVSRVVFSEQEEGTYRASWLAKVHMRLGDISMETGNFEAAIADFKESLAQRETMADANERAIADVHYMLGTAWQYHGSNQNNPAEMRAMSLQHFCSAERILKKLANHATPAADSSAAAAADDEDEDEGGESCSKGKGKGKQASPVSVSSAEVDGESSSAMDEAGELRLILGELREKIEELESASEAAADKPEAAADGSTTTVGFGNVTPAPSATGTTSVGFGAPSSTLGGFSSSTFDGAGAATAAPVNMLMAVKKKSTAAVAPTAAADSTTAVGSKRKACEAL
jgi:HAT1-interacting factor 1